MNKKILGAIVVIAVIAVALFTMSGGSKKPTDAAGAAANALPSFDANANYVLLGSSGKSDLPGAMRAIGHLVKIMPDLYAVAGDAGAVDDEMPDGASELTGIAAKYVYLLADIVGSGEDMFCFVSETNVISGITATDAGFKAMTDKLAEAADSCGPWDDDAIKALGGEAVRATFVEGGEPVGSLGLVKLKNGASNVVLVTHGDGIPYVEAAAAALKDPAKRAKVERQVQGPDFVQYRYEADHFGVRVPIRGETSWTQTKESISLENATKAAGTKSPATSGVEKSPVPIFGSDPHVVLGAFDVPYIISNALPFEDAPIEKALEKFEEISGIPIPSDYRDDVIAVLSKMRVSFGVSLPADAKLPSAAYALIEMTDISPLEKYLSLAELMLSRVDIAGWDTALSAPIDDGINAIIAKRKGGILIGIGAPEVYAKEGKRPADMTGKPTDGALSMLYISGAALMANTEVSGTVAEVLGDDGLARILDLLKPLGLDKIKSISSLQTTPERSTAIIGLK